MTNLFGGSDEEKKEDTKESGVSKDTQTVAGDDGDASKEKVTGKERKCQQQMRQQHVHQMLHSLLTLFTMILSFSQLLILRTLSNLYHLLERKPHPDKDTKDRLEL